MQKNGFWVFTTQLIGLTQASKTDQKRNFNPFTKLKYNKTCLLLFVGVILWANLDFALWVWKKPLLSVRYFFEAKESNVTWIKLHACLCRVEQILSTVFTSSLFIRFDPEAGQFDSNLTFLIAWLVLINCFRWIIFRSSWSIMKLTNRKSRFLSNWEKVNHWIRHC